MAGGSGTLSWFKVQGVSFTLSVVHDLELGATPDAPTLVGTGGGAKLSGPGTAGLPPIDFFDPFADAENVQHRE